MAIQTINSTDIVRTTGLSKINANFSDLDTTKADIAGQVFTGPISATNLSGTNTGDQTDISDFSGTKAEFNTACSDGNFAYLGNNNVFTGTGNTSFAGNLGVGTTNPESKLMVQDTTNSTLIVNSTSNGTNTRLKLLEQAQSLNDFGLMIEYDSSNSQISSLNNGVESNIMSFQHATGNVGIGTTNPSEKLEVVGNIRANEIKGRNDLKVGGYNGTRYINFDDNGNIDYVSGANHTFSSGNVGIGTTSPPSRLEIRDVGGSALTSGILRVSTSDDDTNKRGLKIGALSNSYAFIQGSTYTSNNGILALNPEGGNVGIGTSTPGSKLSVVGLPTSSSGLSAGDIWNDSGTLKII